MGPGPAISPTTLALLGRIAGAIREELGEAIDAYPGCRSPEGADPINRAFRAVVRSLAGADAPTGADLGGIASRLLLRLAEGRLAAEGWDDGSGQVPDRGGAGRPRRLARLPAPQLQVAVRPLLDPEDA